MIQKIEKRSLLEAKLERNYDTNPIIQVRDLVFDYRSLENEVNRAVD